MKDAMKTVDMRVTEQGAVRVSTAYVHKEAPDIVCIYVDLHSKRAERPMCVNSHDGPPALYFTAGDCALHLDESKPRDSVTIVELPEYSGWTFFACDGPARYTLSVVLIRGEESTQAALALGEGLGPLPDSPL